MLNKKKSNRSFVESWSLSFVQLHLHIYTHCRETETDKGTDSNIHTLNKLSKFSDESLQNAILLDCLQVSLMSHYISKLCWSRQVDNCIKLWPIKQLLLCWMLRQCTLYCCALDWVQPRLSSSFLLLRWGGGRWWLKHLGSWNPCGKFRSCLLVSTYSYFDNISINGEILCLSLSLCHLFSTFEIHRSVRHFPKKELLFCLFAASCLVP